MFAELADTLVQSGHNQTVEIPTIFKGPVTIDGSVVCLGLIGDVDLQFILNDAVISNPAQVRIKSQMLSYYYTHIDWQ